MKMSDLIQPGDRIDIQLVYQVERQQNGEDIEVKLYKSKVCDWLSDINMEILMPTESGKMVLFQIGVRCEMIIYTKRGMYKVNAKTKERYKKDNLYFLVMEIVEPPVKFQRREFFRISYIADMKFYRVTPEIAELQTTEELFHVVHDPEVGLEACRGMVQDISGGGIRFVTDQIEEIGRYLVVELHLSNDMVNENFYLLCKVVSSEPMQEKEEKFSNRAKFIYKDLKDRETIVRFVFEEERRIRKKVIG